jgi:hypothetical protein
VTIDRNTGRLGTRTTPDQTSSIHAIYNGWFDGQYCHFPPPPNIKPLFISFHINEQDHSQDKSFSVMNSKHRLPTFTEIASHVDYLKSHQPIGCRDLHTVKLLQEHSIEAYFSGCLTLTLKNHFATRTDEILVVDAHVMCLKLYEHIVPLDVREAAVPLRQAIRQRAPHAEKMKMAQNFLDRLAQAKLVITSRLHTALPCLAFGTPVIFLHENLQDVRFAGLLPFLKAYTTGDCLDVDLRVHRNPNSETLTNLVNTLRENVYSWVNARCGKLGSVRPMKLLGSPCPARKESTSIISVCMNRNEQLAMSLPTWVAAGPDEVVLVDWGSTRPVQAVVDRVLTPIQARKVSVITVTNVDKWVLTRSFNLAASRTTCANLLKVDADTILEPDFFAYHNLDSGPPHFFAGDWTQARSLNERHTNGVVFLKRADFFAVGGYNELITTYGHDDCDLYKRLHKSLGLRRLLLNLDLVRHIEHSNAMRTENQLVATPHRLDVEIELNRLLSELMIWTGEFSHFAIVPPEQNPEQQAQSTAQLRLQYVSGLELSENIRRQLLCQALKNRNYAQNPDREVESKNFEWGHEDHLDQNPDTTGLVSFPSGKKLYLHTKNGLGNRLRALASAYNVARYARRELVVIWIPDFHCQAKFADLFRTNYLFKRDVKFVESIEALQEMDLVRTFKDGFRDERRNCVVYNYDQCKDRYIDDTTPDDIYIVSACTLNSRFSNWTRDSFILRHLEMTDEIAEQVFLFELELLDKGAPIERAVGVHVRMGQPPEKFPHEDVSFYSKASKDAITKWRDEAHWTRFVAEMERISKADPSVVFFLCCDNEDAYKELEALGKFKLVSTQKTVFDRSVGQIQNAVVDLVLLSKTNYILGSNWSSFTEVAHRLSGTKLRVAGVDF